MSHGRHLLSDNQRHETNRTLFDFSSKEKTIDTDFLPVVNRRVKRTGKQILSPDGNDKKPHTVNTK